jgi:hypothetical protein
MTEERHYFVPSKNKKDCEKCKKLYNECMNWVDLFVIEGPKERDFYWKNEKANYVTDLYTFELVQTIPTLEENLKIVTIESTRHLSFMLNKKGQTICWGMSDSSEDPSMFNQPSPVKELVGIQIVALACGDSHVLALEMGMYVWSWGNNDYFQLSRDFEEKVKEENSKFPFANRRSRVGKERSKDEENFYMNPKRIEEINNIVRISAGPFSSFAVHMNGIVYAWGKNYNFSLGIEQENNVKKATELHSCPWVKETKKSKKSYFKSEKIREVEIAGACLSNIRAMKVENMDLHNRILLLSKKVDFLEDENVNVNNKKMKKLWDSDPDLKDLIKLKSNCEKLNEDIDEQVKVIEDDIEKLNEKKKDIMKKIETKDGELSELWESITKIEREMKKFKKESVSTKRETNEKQIGDIDGEILTKAEARKEQQAQLMNKELEKKSLKEEIEKVDIDIKNAKKKITSITKSKDLNIKTYEQMASIKKKQISEKNILKFSSRTYQEIQEIKKYFDVIENSSFEFLTKEIGRLSHPEEIISISNQMLEILRLHVKEKFKVSGFAYVGNTRKVWVVIDEIIKTALEVNTLKQTICSKLLKSSKPEVKIDEENLDGMKIKAIKKVFKEVDITDFNIQFDDFMKKIGEKEKKASMKKLITEGAKKKSGWRSCF